MSFQRVMIRTADYSGPDKVIDEILDRFNQHWPKKKILIKPNVLGPWVPERGVTTHPSIIAALVRCLTVRGAKVSVGDNPGLFGYADNEKCFRASGIFEASQGKYINIGKSPVRAKIKSKYVNTIAISREVLECDLLISVPKFKTHTLTMITGAIKNSYGFIVGAEKAMLHAAAPSVHEFSEAVVDVYSLRPPDLSIMDAVICMEGNGPSGGTLRNTGRILASDSAVALDAVMASMMGKEPSAIPMLAISNRRALGSIDLSKIEIDGTFEAMEAFNMPHTFAGGFINRLVNRHVFPFLIAKPYFDLKRCKRCMLCYEGCPVKAILWEKGPVLQRRKCISCFCCMEKCVYDAVGFRNYFFRCRDLILSRSEKTRL
jgi:uncharacterized protein (DUF362 family)/Pyruvate/2-oxoacid:ferredoxin oxidoreductase delta subunit